MILAMIFFSVLSLSPFWASATNQKTAGRRSLEELAALYEKANNQNDMESELAALKPYLAEAIRQNNVREEQYARISKIYCYYNFDAFDLLYPEIDRQMAYFSRRGWWDQYNICANVRVEALIFQDKPASALHEADRLYAEAKKSGRSKSLVMAAYNLFCCYHYSNRHEEAARIFEEDILKHKEDIPSGSESDYYTVYSDVLVSLKRYDDLLKHSVAYEKMLDEDEEERLRNGIVYDNSAQLLYAYHSYAEAYLGLGEIDKAEMYYDKALAITRDIPNNRVGLYDLHARILHKKGNYTEALFEIEHALNDSGAIENRTLRNNYLSLKADLLCEIKRFAEACTAYKEVIQLTDSVSNSEQAIQLNDLRSIYELDRLKQENEQASARFLIALIICGAMALTITLSVIYSQRLRMKNRLLVDRIQEETLLEQERRDLQAICRNVTEVLPVSSTPDTIESALFVRLRELLLKERLYLVPELNRDMLLERLGTNKNKLNETVVAATGHNLMEYITGLRLQEALLLMEAYPDRPFNQIAEQTGFSVYSSFYRAFYRQYGVKPTDYKNYRKK